MIYLDTSVLLAQCLAEDQKPPAALWTETLVSSRLIEYETAVRLHALSLEETHGDAARSLLSRIAMLELPPPVLQRALEPFPIQIRTLEALHLASIDYLRTRRVQIELASYDRRMTASAEALGIPLVSLV